MEATPVRKGQLGGRPLLLSRVQNDLPGSPFAAGHLLPITTVKWRLQGPVQPPLRAGPSGQGLHLPSHRLPGLHADVSALGLRCSPSWNAPGGPPSPEVSPSSDCKFHLLTVSTSLAPDHKGGYVFRSCPVSASLPDPCLGSSRTEQGPLLL